MPSALGFDATHQLRPPITSTRSPPAVPRALTRLSAAFPVHYTPALIPWTSMSSSTMLPGFSKLEINDIMHLPRDYDLGGLVSNRYGNGNRDRNGYHRGIGSTGTPDRASPAKGLGAATPTRSRNGDVYWNGYKLRKSPEEDVSRYQFWPNAMAMGSFIGKTFIQVRSPCTLHLLVVNRPACRLMTSAEPPLRCSAGHVSMAKTSVESTATV